MALSLKHAFQSVRADGDDSTLVQPSNWNAEHSLQMATGRLVGRTSSGTGAAEEISVGSGLTLNAGSLTADGVADGGVSTAKIADGAVTAAKMAATLDLSGKTLTLPASATGFTTGDAKFTFKDTADAGWVMADDGSIGDASSGATTRANADTEALFTLLWNKVADASAPVSSGRGANASADFAAHKKMTLPKTLGHALGVAGAGSGLTSRALGSSVGAETAVADLAAHTHGVGTLAAASGGAHTHNVTLNTDTGGGTGVRVDAVAAETTSVSGVISSDGAHTHTVSGATGSAGAGGGHNNMQPTTFLNLMVKL